MSKEKLPATPAFPENWREVDHPFYNLVKDILAGKGATALVNPGELIPEVDFWGKKAPEEIIIATGSTRKAFMLSVVLNRIEVPLKEAMDFQEFIVRSIYNGDGSLKGKTFLGEFHGVPVFAESAAAGETAGNNPKAEAVNKALWMSGQRDYKGRNVLIVSTDTVDFLDRDKNGEISNGEDGLGKPMNHQDYPQQNWLMNSKIDLIRKLGEKVFSWQEASFFAAYTKENFIEGFDLVHTNAIAILELLSTGDEELVRIWQAIIKSTIDEEFFANYRPVFDQGGGGASQQNQNWESAEEIFSSLDKESQQVLATIKETDPAFFKFLVIFQISGMPAMNILRQIEDWAETKRATLTQKEVVVFEAE